MHFTVERKRLVKMLEAARRKWPGQKKKDKQVRLYACAARVFIEANSVTAGEEALVFRDGGCPLCETVYIVSKQIHGGERKCPACGKSLGLVTGGRESGGSASIVWEDAPVFVLGRKYSREEISEILGGSDRDYLPTDKKRVVCGCFTLDHNPEAPAVVIPGTGKVIERTAKMFCEQEHPVPVFIKRQPKEWEYVGHFKAEKFSTDRNEIAVHHKGSITPSEKITRVIFLKRATTNES